MITSKRLHRRVVDHSDGFPECLPKIETDPALSEIFWILCNPALVNRRRKTNRDDVAFPIADFLFYSGNHFARRQSLAGIEFLSFPVPRNQQLHVRTADVDDEDLFLLHLANVFLVIWTSRMPGSFFAFDCFFVFSRDRSRK